MDRDAMINDLEEAINFVFTKSAEDIPKEVREELVANFKETILINLSDEVLDEKFNKPEGTLPLENAVEMFNDYLESLDEQQD